VLDVFRRELDAAYDEGGLFQLTMHPHIDWNRCIMKYTASSRTHSTGNSTMPVGSPWSSSSDEGGLFQLTMHPHIIGYRSRIWILEEIVRHAKAKGDVWFASVGKSVKLIS
jgi:hypothetical protein